MNRSTRKLLSTIITAVTNFSTQYNYQCIAVALLIMSSAECTTNDGDCKKGSQDSWVHSTSTAGIFLGSIVGQLTLGFLGDIFSRTSMLLWTMIIALISSVLSSVASYGPADSVYTVIIVFRFFLGVGLGGVYPLSASKASEDAADDDKKSVNSFAAAKAQFWQVIAFFAPWFVCYVLTFTTLSTDAQWRLVLGIGAIPSFLAIILLLLEIHWFEVQSVERDFEAVIEHGDVTTRMTTVNLQDVPTTTTTVTTAAVKETKISIASVWKELQESHELQRKLLASGLGWFLYDVLVYGISLLSGYIITDIALDDDAADVTTTTNLRKIASAQMIITSVTIGITIIGVLLVPLWGLQPLQTIGFLVVGGFSTLVASVYTPLSHGHPMALFALYTLLYASLNFGLGSTTYALPAALFPKHIRATCNGIAAATGKFGAFLGAFLFPYIAQSSGGYPLVLALSAGVAFVGAFVTYRYVNPKELMNGDAERIFGRWANLPEANTGTTTTMTITTTNQSKQSVDMHKGSIPPNTSFASTMQSSPTSVRSSPIHSPSRNGSRSRSRSDSSSTSSSSCMMIPLPSSTSSSPGPPSSTSSPKEDEKVKNTPTRKTMKKVINEEEGEEEEIPLTTTTTMNILHAHHHNNNKV